MLGILWDEQLFCSSSNSYSSTYIRKSRKYFSVGKESHSALYCDFSPLVGKGRKINATVENNVSNVVGVFSLLKFLLL